MMIEKATMAGTACLILGGAIGFGPVLARVGLLGSGAGDGPPVAVAVLQDEHEGGKAPGRTNREIESEEEIDLALPEPDLPAGPQPAQVGDPASIRPGRIRDFLDPGPPLNPVPPFLLQTPEEIAKPWETAVKLVVNDNRQVRTGSGTIIESDWEVSYVLTHSGMFKDGFNGVFDESLMLISVFASTNELDGQQVALSRDRMIGQLIACDPHLHLALIRIHHGPLGPLKASPLLPPSRKIQEGTSMITAGCVPDSMQASLWSTKVLRQFRSANPNEPIYRGFQSRDIPDEDHMGGGLFTEDGYLAGVLNIRLSEFGLYGDPEMIREFLAEHRPELLVQAEEEGLPERLASANAGTSVLPAPAEPPAVGESTIIPPSSITYVPPTDIPQGQEVQPQTQPEVDRLDRIERRLDELIAALAGGEARADGPSRPAARAVDFDSYRPKLLELLERGPIRLVFAEPFEATLLLKSAEDIERTESILRAMFGQGSPILIEREPATVSHPREGQDLVTLDPGQLSLPSPNHDPIDSPDDLPIEDPSPF